MLKPTRRRRAQGLVWVFVAGAFVVGALGMYILKPKIEGLFASEASTEQTGPERNAINALGTIEPKGGIIHLAAAPGDIVAEILVEPDQKVNADQPLIKLASYALRDAEVRQLELRQTIIQQQREAAQQVGESHKQIAQQKIDRLDPDSDFYKREIQQKRDELGLLDQQLQNANTELARIQALSAVPGQEKARLEYQIAQLEGQIGIAELALKQAEATAAMDRVAAELELSAAEKEMFQKINELPTDEELAIQIDLAKQRRDQSLITAPKTGKVLKIFAKVGEPVTSAPLLQMADLTTMMVRAEVYETDIPLLSEWATQSGNVEAIVTKEQVFGSASDNSSSRYPYEPLTGHLVEPIGRTIGQNQVVPLDPIADTDRRVVEVLVELDNASPADTFLGMQVNVKFTPE